MFDAFLRFLFSTLPSPFNPAWLILTLMTQGSIGCRPSPGSYKKFTYQKARLFNSTVMRKRNLKIRQHSSTTKSYHFSLLGKIILRQTISVEQVRGYLTSRSQVLSLPIKLQMKSQCLGSFCKTEMLYLVIIYILQTLPQIKCFIICVNSFQLSK